MNIVECLSDETGQKNADIIIETKIVPHSPTPLLPAAKGNTQPLEDFWLEKDIAEPYSDKETLCVVFLEK